MAQWLNMVPYISRAVSGKLETKSEWSHVENVNYYVLISPLTSLFFAAIYSLPTVNTIAWLLT